MGEISIFGQIIPFVPLKWLPFHNNSSLKEKRKSTQAESSSHQVVFHSACVCSCGMRVRARCRLFVLSPAWCEVDSLVFLNLN